MKPSRAPFLALIAAFSYWGMVLFHDASPLKLQGSSPEVVLPAPAQVLLYFGDRFIAANIEEIRLLGLTGVSDDSQYYRLRSHTVVSELHPCHEDNYWIGNVALSWGGSVNQGLDLLANATRCRFWDEWPPFFYGFNQNFFFQDVEQARRLAELAAKRSKNNAAIFRTYATMLAANKIDNLGMALKMLEQERDKVKDNKLRKQLDKRVVRLEGLIALRGAQAEYEKEFNKKLHNPKSLLDTKLLERLPDDPLGIGYEYREGTFHLKQLKIK